MADLTNLSAPAQTDGSLTGSPASSTNSTGILSSVDPSTPATTGAPAAPATPVATTDPNAGTAPGMLSDWYNNYIAAQPGGVPQPAQATAATANAGNWSVDPNQTVQSQLKNVLDTGGPLMTMADTTGRQKAAASGLLNSTMGIQSAQEALYGAATPIATSDANTYASAAKENAGPSPSAARSAGPRSGR